MNDFLSHVASYAIIPATVLVASIVYGITKWAGAQKAVASNKYTSTVIAIVNETALAIATSLTKLPVDQPATFNQIKNDVLNTAVNSILSNFKTQVSKAGMDSLALHTLLSNSVATYGAGSAIPTEIGTKYKLNLMPELTAKESYVVKNTVIPQVESSIKQ